VVAFYVSPSNTLCITLSENEFLKTTKIHIATYFQPSDSMASAISYIMQTKNIIDPSRKRQQVTRVL